MEQDNLVPRSHSVLHLAVGDLGTRLGTRFSWKFSTELCSLVWFERSSPCIS